MRKTPFSEEQMVKILRVADRAPVAEVVKKHGVSDVTIYAWRKRFGQLEAVDVKRLRQLEHENGRLKKLLAERVLDSACRRIQATLLPLPCGFGARSTQPTLRAERTIRAALPVESLQ